MHQNSEREDSVVKVLFVCLGNICRSPLAEGVFRSLIDKAGLQDRVLVRSVGTGGWHVGEQADERMRQTARQYGVSLEKHCADQIRRGDLETYDYILVMDRRNLSDVLSLDPGHRYHHKIRLFRDFDPEPGDRQVPDPYYGGAEGFHNVYRIVDRTARALLDHLIQEHALQPVM